MLNASKRLAAAVIDRYVVERELGSGGMATVYLAREATGESGFNLWQLPLVYAARGDTEKAFELPHPYAAWLVPRDETSPWFSLMRTLRGEPRYQALLQRLNLPPGIRQYRRGPRTKRPAQSDPNKGIS